MRFAAINIFCREILGRPDLKLKIPKSKKRNTDILTSEQVELILEYAKARRKSFYAVVLLLYECALRRNEVCSLNMDDIHFESKEIYLRATKTGDHIVTMTSRVSEAIKDYITNERTTLHETEPALLVNNRGTRIGEHFVRDTLKRYAVAVGITHRVYPHILRASCITHLLNRGVNPRTVQAHARHSDFQTTMLYNRPTQQQMREDIQRCFTQQPRDDTKRNSLYLEQYCRGEISSEEFLQLLVVPPKKTQSRPTTEPAGYL
jgi:site-specific recombinase XerD